MTFLVNTLQLGLCTLCNGFCDVMGMPVSREIDYYCFDHMQSVIKRIFDNAQNAFDQATKPLAARNTS